MFLRTIYVVAIKVSIQAAARSMGAAFVIQRLERLVLPYLKTFPDGLEPDRDENLRDSLCPEDSTNRDKEKAQRICRAFNGRTRRLYARHWILSLNDTDKDQNDRHEEKQVYEPAQGIARDEAERPEDEEQYCNGDKHGRKATIG